MVEKLRHKVIYDDFVSKVHLTEEQVKILKMLIEHNKGVKISMELGMSERTLGYEIRKLKDLYNGYLELERTKLSVLLNK